MRQAAWLALCRRHLMPFIKHMFPQYIVYPWTKLVVAEVERFMEAVVADESPRLIVEVPFRVGKSEIISRQLPPWILGNHPDWYVGLVSYGDDLAWELSADARRIVQSEEFAEVFGPTFRDIDPVEIDTATKSVTHWRIKDHRGGVRAAGLNGALTGRGYKVVVIDDPMKGRREADSLSYRDERWTQYNGTFYPRVEPGGGIILMGTRWHPDDLIGRCLEKARNEPETEQWRRITIPAQALPGQEDVLGRAVGEFLDSRFTPDQWARMKIQLPEREWLAQCQQQPRPDEGVIFRPYEQFVFLPPPVDDLGDLYRGPRYAFADTSHAKTRESDFSAIAVWQIEPDRTLGLLDMFRGRVQYPELKRLARDMMDRWGVWRIAIEDYSAGRALAQEFIRDFGRAVMPWRPDRDKIARAHAAVSVMESWRIRLPAGSHFPSGLPVRVFLEELADFRAGAEHDDMVDVTTMAMILIGTRGHGVPRTLRSSGFGIDAA